MGTPQPGLVHEWKRRSTAQEGHDRPAIWIVADLEAAPGAPALLEALEATRHALAAGGARPTLLTAAPSGRPLEAAVRLGRALLADRAQVVHFHLIGAGSPLVAAAKLAGARVIVSEHAPGPRPPVSTAARVWHQARMAALHPLVDVRVAAARTLAAAIAREGVAPAGLVVIEEGLSLERLRAVRPDGVKRALGCVGRPLVACVAERAGLHQPGLEAALEALPLLGRSAVYALASPPGAADGLRRLVRARGLEASVRLVPLDADASRLYAAADVVVVPAEPGSEGVAASLAVLEALALGRPVVVPERTLHADRADSGALVVPPRDAGALAGAITRLFDDPLLARRLGRAAHERATRRSGLQRLVDDTLHLYRSLSPALDRAQAA